MRTVSVVGCGQPPVVVDRDAPQPGDGEVGVTVTAAPITPLDVLCASGTSYFGTPATPYVPGVQGVGELDDGTRVWFPTAAGMRPGDGSMAERVAVPAADVVRLPDGVEDTLLAALGLSAVAAWMALTWRGGLAPGEQVVILGGGGIVGQAAIQLARLHGARRVVAVCRSASAQAKAASCGADAVVPLAGADVGTLAAAIRDVLDGPADLVVDPLFGVPAAAALRTLAPHGRLVNLGSSAGETAPIDSATLRSGSLRILGYTNNELTPAQKAGAIDVVAAHALAGELTVAHQVVPLEDVGTAWQRQSDGLATERIVLKIGARR